jgi:hypothetical protein
MTGTYQLLIIRFHSSVFYNSAGGIFDTGFRCAQSVPITSPAASARDLSPIITKNLRFTLLIMTVKKLDSEEAITSHPPRNDQLVER